ncbi:MAG: PKD domain-containing protein [Bacteroidetes bacterium]|nr:MAG: PKD domain-containing protein [Bacteroidota bacterium]
MKNNLLKLSYILAIFAMVSFFGCKKDTATPLPTVTFDAVGTAQVGKPVTFTNKTIDATTYEWFVAGTSAGTTKDLTYTFTKSGDYEVKLTAKGDGGINSASKTITITDLPVTDRPVITVTGEITRNTTWSVNNRYLLSGFVYVVDGVTLTIEAGTIIKGDKDSKATLIIERGAKLIAEGTAQKPIVFTSNKAKGQRDYGDWGGIVLCGKAQNNLPGGDGILEGGIRSRHGGTDNADNSGILKYVRIEFPGIAFQPNQEINGLTLGSVGSGTQISYVQVSFCGDDSYEWFGGSVNCKYLIAHRGWDDDFDTDNGFSGKVQFGVALRDPKIADASGSNGFESDNDGQGTAATPLTSAVFSNISMLGPLATPSTEFNNQFKRGAHLRRNTNLSIHNTIISGYPETGMLVDGSLAEANATADRLKVRNTILSGNSKNLTVNANSTFDILTWFNTANRGNRILAGGNADLRLTNPFNLTAPNFLPQTGSPALTGGSTQGLDAFFENVSFIGAFGTTDWTAGWTNFDPQNTDY